MRIESSEDDDDDDIESSSLPSVEPNNRVERPVLSPMQQGAPVDIARNTSTPDNVSNHGAFFFHFFLCI